MGHHEVESLTLALGEVKSLPGTLSLTRHLTVALVEVDVTGKTAVFELHNPEAEPDEMVAGLIEEDLEDVEAGNRWRDRLHLPQTAVPVDTSTMPVEAIHATLHEKLRIGDRVWTVSDIAVGSVTLTPGHDSEARTLVNDAENLEVNPKVIAIAESLDAIDRSL